VHAIDERKSLGIGILYTVLASLNDNSSSPSAVTAAIAAFDSSASVGGAFDPFFLTKYLYQDKTKNNKNDEYV
jgi:hypothetical protein